MSKSPESNDLTQVEFKVCLGDARYVLDILKTNSSISSLSFRRDNIVGFWSETAEKKKRKKKSTIQHKLPKLMHKKADKRGKRQMTV